MVENGRVSGVKQFSVRATRCSDEQQQKFHNLALCCSKILTLT